MSDTENVPLLDALLDSWDRNNTIPINLLRAVPEDARGLPLRQIKLALKAAGRPFDDDEIGQLTWDVWMDKTAPS